MSDNLLRLLLYDSLQAGLAEAEVLEVFEGEPSLLLPQLAVRGDDALQTLLVVTAVRVRYAAPC